MNQKEAIAEAKLCFRNRVRGMYGYIDRKNDPILEDHPQKEFINQCRNYWAVVFSAFETYSKGNAVVEQAKLKRDRIVDEAYKNHFAEEAMNYDPHEFLRKTYHAYDQYALEVAPVFHEFKKALKKRYPIVI
jgi:arylsulfatase A-like enzyme